MTLPVHEWQCDLGPYTGRAGEVKVLQLTPQVHYRVDNFFATDDSPNPGYGTRIGKMIVGNKLQRPADTSTLTAQVGAGTTRVRARAGTYGSSDEGAIYWDMCPPGSTLSVEVIFVQACTFNFSFWGVAIG